MSRHLLDMQATRIEEVLDRHRLPARVWGGTVLPRFIRFYLVPQIGVRLSRIKALSEELALALGASSCRIVRRGSSLHVEIPRSDPTNVHLLTLCRRLGSIPPLCAALGVDEQGVPIIVRLSSPDVAHILISGTTGSGKTALARTMITSLAMYNHLGKVQIILIDPKRRGFAPFAQLPHLLCPLLQEPDEARGRLQWLLHEMERRDRESISAPRIILFIDELADLIFMGGKQVEKALIRLSQRGRQAGIHLVACTQKPTAAVIGSLVKSNFPVRIVGSVTCPEDAKVASGLAGTGAERLGGRGDFLLVSRGETTRFQAAHVSEEEISTVVGRLQSGRRGSRRWDDRAPTHQLVSESAREPASSRNWLKRGLQLVKR